ncbi:hypothetical protein Hanom_Chr09g00782951 [Helianthus anomalus]
MFGDVDVGVWMKRITALEEDKISKDVQIASLLEKITHKNQQIQDLETNVESLSSMVMDLKQKLEEKLGKEFAEPRKEYTKALNKYIENPPRTTNQRLKQKVVIMRNVGNEKDYGFQDLPNRYVVTTGRDRYDRYDNRTRIQSWVYNDENEMFLLQGRMERLNIITLPVHLSLDCCGSS